MHACMHEAEQASVHVCKHVSMFAGMHARCLMHACMFCHRGVCILVWLHEYVWCECVSAYVWGVCVCVRVGACIRACVHACVCACVHACQQATHACMHTHTHTHTHT